ncbi:MAG: hypothetical protein ABI629_01020 [bacterium]
MKQTLLVALGLAFCASAASAADNYACYKAKDLKVPAKFAGSVADLSDEIIAVNDNAEIKKPFLYCAPSSLNGSAIADPATKLTCYKIRGVKGINTTKTITDAFGTTQLGVKAKVYTYCVPATAS